MVETRWWELKRAAVEQGTDLCLRPADCGSRPDHLGPVPTSGATHFINRSFVKTGKASKRP